MAVSSSADFSLTKHDLIVEARKKIGLHQSEEPLSNAELAEASTTLNMMLKAWQSGGVSYTHLTEGTITLAQADYSLAFGSGGAFTTVPVEITDMRLVRSSVERPMFRLSREDYYSLPNKTNQGCPTQWYYDKQRAGGTLKIWPAADATAGTLNFTYRRFIWDMDANADDLDLPPEWYECVVYNLADRFAEEYGMVGTPAAQMIAAKARESLSLLKEFDTGEGMGSITIVPSDIRRPRAYR